MEKSELIKHIARQARLSKVDAKKALDAVSTSVLKALKKGDSLAMPGVGIFSVAKRKARVGRNPQTGKAIRIPAKSVPKFTAAKALKQAVKK